MNLISKTGNESGNPGVIPKTSQETLNKLVNTMYSTDSENYTNAQEILPGLWLGNYKASQDLEFLKKNNIEVIVNATKHLPNKFKNQFLYLRVPVDDPGPYVSNCDEDIVKMKMYLPFVLDFIRSNRKLKRNMLIHCHAGAQRSAIITAAYMIEYAKTKSDLAINKKVAVIKYIICKRPQAFFGGLSVNFASVL